MAKKSKSSIWDWIIRLVLLVAGLSTLLPFLYVIALSFLSEKEYSARGLVIPAKPTLDNYIMFFKWGTKIQDAYISTLFITIVGTAIALSATAMLAYGNFRI